MFHDNVNRKNTLEAKGAKKMGFHGKRCDAVGLLAPPKTKAKLKRQKSDSKVAQVSGP